MAEKKEELIDLNRLSQRELLILMHAKVEAIEKTIEQINEREQQMALKVNSLETKSRMWGSIAGFGSAIIAILIERLFRL